jgi:hypothetical protein
MVGQSHAPAVLPSGKTRYPFYRRLGGPQGRGGSVQEISPTPGFDSRTVHPIVSRYIDRAIPDHSKSCYTLKFQIYDTVLPQGVYKADLKRYARLKENWR